MRAAYAEAQTAYLTEANGGNATYNKTAKTVTVSNVVAKGTKEGFNDAEKELPFATKMDDSAKAMGGTPGTYTVTFTYDDNGAIDSVSAEKKA